MLLEALALGSLVGFLVACGVLFLTALVQNDLGRFNVIGPIVEADDVIEIESTGTCPHCGGEIAGTEELIYEKQAEQERV